MSNRNHRLGLPSVACAVAMALVASAVQAETTRERILREGKIVVGIANQAPWGYRDKNGATVGFHPDLVKAAFEKLGVDKIDIVTTEFGALIPGLMANRFDLVAAGLYITPERCKLVAFSEPDLRLADAAVVLKGNPKGIRGYADIAAKADTMFGSVRGSVTAKNAAAAGVPEARTLLFPDIQTNVAALLSGRIDIGVFSTPTAISILSDPNVSGVERALPFEGLIEEGGKERAGFSAIAFRLDDSDLRDLYNARLAELRADRTAHKIMEKYGFGVSESVPDNLTTQELCGRKP